MEKLKWAALSVVLFIALLYGLSKDSDNVFHSQSNRAQPIHALSESISSEQQKVADPEGVDRKAPTPGELSKIIKNSPNLFAAVQQARASKNGDAIRIARDVVKECFNIVSSHEPRISRSKNDASWVQQSQFMAATDLTTQCSGFYGMDRRAERELLAAIANEVTANSGELAKLDALLEKSRQHPLSDDDRAQILSALRSHDGVMANLGIQALAPMLGNANLGPSDRPTFWYGAMLGLALKDSDGVNPLYPATTFDINQACVADLVCRVGGETRDTGESKLTPEMARIQQAYVVALKTNSWNAITAVR